jgi:hypothetical protein
MSATLAKELDQRVLHRILRQRRIIEQVGGIAQQRRLIGFDDRLHAFEPARFRSDWVCVQALHRSAGSCFSEL